MNTQTVSQQELITLIAEASAGGQFFSASFIKRSTGDLREMICRGGVRCFEVGGTPLYDPDEHNLLWVWDSHGMGGAGSYRSIPCEGVLNAVIEGIRYEVIDHNLELV